MLPYKNVLAAVDFSEIAETVVNRARTLAAGAGAKLILFHAVEAIPPAGLAGEPFMPLGPEIDLELLEANAARQLAELAARCGLGDKEQVIVSGSAKIAITRYARENDVDLIVLGSHGRHGLDLLLGSTADGVLHRAHCDVLAARAPENKVGQILP